MPANPLVDLDSVDWASMRHAYGAADDVPELLRRFWTGTDDERSQVVDELYATIWHQSTVYEATPHATRFLVAMLSHESCLDRSSLLGLLAAIAQGMNYIDQHSSMSWERISKGDPEFERQRQQGRAYVTQSRAAVAEGLDVCRTLLADTDDSTSIAAAAVLAEFVDEDPAIVDLLLDALTHARTDKVAAGLAQIFLDLAGRPSDPIDRSAEVYRSLDARGPQSDVVSHRLAFRYLSELGDDDVVDSFLTEVHEAQADVHRYHRLLEVIEQTLGPSSPELIRFFCAWFPYDASLTQIYLSQIAEAGGARDVCEGIAQLLQDPAFALSAEGVGHALEVLASAGTRGIEALEILQSEFDGPESLGVKIEDYLDRARLRRMRYSETRLWHRAPDTTWTVDECVELIGARLNTRQQDADIRIRAAVRLIEFGEDAAPASIGHRLAELHDDTCQLAAANLLWSANGDPEAVITILGRQFRGGNLVLTADLARRMGPAAAALVPRFHELLAQERIVTGGIAGELVFAEEAVREAIQSAIAAIGWNE